MLRPGGGAAADQNAGENEGEIGSQSMVRPVYSTGCTTRRMLLAFARGVWRLILAIDNGYFVLPTLEEQADLTNWEQEAESAVSGGAPGGFDDAGKSVPKPEENDEWK